MLKRVLNLASLGFAGLLAWLLVRIVMGLMAPESLIKTETVDTLSPAQLSGQISGQGSASTVTTRRDFTSDPFGQGAGAIVVTPDIALDVPETTLQLELMGRTTGPDGGAILRLPDGTEKRVGVGQELMDNVLLESVQAGFILLQVDGQAQRLTFEKTESLVGTQTLVTPGSEANLATVRPMGEMQRFLRDVNMQPKRDAQNKIIGLAVTARGAAGTTALEQLGLRTGDVVTRLGTVDLTTARTNMAEVQRLIASGQPVDIEYIRNGERKFARVGQ